jgi:hypothetical protein
MAIRAQIATSYKFPICVVVAETDAEVVTCCHGGREGNTERVDNGRRYLRSGYCGRREECPFVSALAQ